MTSLHVNTTSSAVNGSPSLQRRFFRNLNVHVLPSGEFVHDSARPGTICCEGTSKFNNDQNMNRPMSMDDDSFAMMKLNVFGSPISETINLPPRLPGSQSTTTGGSGS